MLYYVITIDTETNNEISRVGPFAVIETAVTVAYLDNKNNRINHKTRLEIDTPMQFMNKTITDNVIVN